MRKKDSKFEYFNIAEWKYMDFQEAVVDEDYYTKEDFVDRPTDWMILYSICCQEQIFFIIAEKKDVWV